MPQSARMKKTVISPTSRTAEPVFRPAITADVSTRPPREGLAARSAMVHGPHLVLALPIT
jgi:hypothetical protein